MYLQNKYTHWYYSIIQRAQSRSISGYTEKHHIIPKSLGGSNSKENIVALTAREHFVCHLLLTKMTENEARSKMSLAVFYLTGNGKARRNNVIKDSRLYENLRKENAKYVSKQKRGCKQPPRTVETKQRLTASKTGKLNPAYKCNWVTPWGVYESSRLAAKACPEYITSVSILNFCQNKNNKPISYLSVCRSKGWLNVQHINKTPAELGFAINTI
jgi:hypothetical protein